MSDFHQAMVYNVREFPYVSARTIFMSRHSSHPSDAIELVLRLLVKLDHEHNVDDVLVDQSKAFLVTVLSM